MTSAQEGVKGSWKKVDNVDADYTYICGLWYLYARENNTHLKLSAEEGSRQELTRGRGCLKQLQKSYMDVPEGIWVPS